MLYLDAEKFQRFFIVRAGNAIGPGQRSPIDLETHHQEVAVMEAQSRVTCRPETKKSLIPVMHGKHTFGVKSRHEDEVDSSMIGASRPLICKVAARVRTTREVDAQLAGNHIASMEIRQDFLITNNTIAGAAESQSPLPQWPLTGRRFRWLCALPHRRVIGTPLPLHRQPKSLR